MQADPVQAAACHPDGTGTAKTCQQRPGSTGVFVPLSLINPVSGKSPSQMPVWPGQAGGEKGRGSYLEGHLWVQREAVRVHSVCLPQTAQVPVLPIKCHHRQLVPGSPVPLGPCQPLSTPTLGEQSQDQAATAPCSWSMGSSTQSGGAPRCHRVMPWLLTPCQSSAAATQVQKPHQLRAGAEGSHFLPLLPAKITWGC